MGKRDRRNNPGELTMAMWAMTVGSMIDTMHAAELENDLIHMFLDRLESGAAAMLRGKGLRFVFFVLDTARSKVPAND